MSNAYSASLVLMPVGVMRSIGVSVRSTSCDVGLVVDLEIAAFERHPARAEAVIFRDQLLGDRRILDPLADLAREEIRDQRVGLAVHQDVAEIAHPDAETGLAVELLPERLALLGCHLGGGTRVGRMDEAAVGLLAARKDLGIIGPDPAHLLLADLGVVQWRAPLGGALEHGQMAGGLGHFRDGLHAGRAGADHRDALALEAHRFLRPVMGVAGLALEGRDAGDGRHGRRREHADGGDQEACGVAPAVLQGDVPACACLPDSVRRSPGSCTGCHGADRTCRRRNSDSARSRAARRSVPPSPIPPAVPAKRNSRRSSFRNRSARRDSGSSTRCRRRRCRPRTRAP